MIVRLLEGDSAGSWGEKDHHQLSDWRLIMETSSNYNSTLQLHIILNGTDIIIINCQISSCTTSYINGINEFKPIVCGGCLWTF